MNRHPVLSDAQREVLETAHFFLDDREIARYWTLSEQDLVRIERRLLAVIRKRRNLDIRRRSCPESGSTPRPQWAEWINPTARAAADGASGRLGELDDARRRDRSGTLMSHARPTVSLPIRSLANAVSLSAGFSPLITTAR